MRSFYGALGALLAITAPVVGALGAAGCGTTPLPEDVNTGGDAPVVDARPIDLGEPATPDCPTGQPSGITLETFAEGLEQPIFLTSPPGEPDRVVVGQQTGLVLLFIDGEQQKVPFFDARALTAPGGERGLLGLAFHPDYAKNGRVFINYTDLDGNSRVDQLQAEGGAGGATALDPASRGNVLFQMQPYSNHNGGHLAFGPDGYLYIGFGDGGSAGDPELRGQDLTTWLGKMLRIDIDRGGDMPYAVPADNPFVDQAEARPEIWASGLRNPWRYSFDREGGMLYIGDVGQGNWEEVNVAPVTAAGLDYGWSTVEGPACYRSDDCDLTASTLPAVSYDHGVGCSITGGYVYRGCDVPALRGRYVYADYCTAIIRSFVYRNGAAADEQDHTDQLGGPSTGISSFGEDGRGELYLLDHPGGQVLRFAPGP